MAKNEKKSTSPFVMCLLMTIIAIIGVFIGFASKNPLWTILFLLPTVIYECMRTEEGASTKTSSIFLLVILLLETLLLVFNIHIDLAQYLGSEEKYIAGYTLPLGDIQVFGPLLTAILATVLVFRTYGPYTRWLSVVIAVGSLALVYLINPSFFQEALKLILNGLFERFQYAY